MEKENLKKEEENNSIKSEDKNINTEHDKSINSEKNLDNNQNYTPRKYSKLEEFAIFATSVAVYFGFIRLVYVIKN